MFAKLCNKIAAAPYDIREHRYPKEQGYIYCVDAFAEVMQREYARSDRNGHGFAFAIFYFPHGNSTHQETNAIIEMVGDRLRVTDHAGWLRHGTCLGVLLYACSTDDAWGFVERLRRDGRFENLKCDVYFYPDDFPENILKTGTEVGNE